MGALEKQVGGSHYKNFKIQPIEFITANNLGFIEGNIVKYICRHPFKNKEQDVDKVKHYAELLLDLVYGVKEEKVKPSKKVSKEDLAIKIRSMLHNPHALEAFAQRHFVEHEVSRDKTIESPNDYFVLGFGRCFHDLAPLLLQALDSKESK